jgi:hypothetical protein
MAGAHAVSDVEVKDKSASPSAPDDGAAGSSAPVTKQRNSLLPIETPPPGTPPPDRPPAVARRTQLRARLRAAARQIVPQLQYQLTRLGAAGQAGLAALTASAVIVVSALVPAHQALQNLTADLARARHESAGANPAQAAPRLIHSLPTRSQMPTVLAQVYAEAKGAGVSLDSGRYTFTPAKSGAFARYELEFPVKGRYPDIRAFVDRTLTALPAAALEKLHVERKTIGDATVNADIGLVVYVRSEQVP